jgi:hypothetical protein
MAAPSVAATSSTDVTSASASWAVNLPSSIASGDLLVLLMRTASTVTITTPSGWTLLASSTADSSDDVTAVYWRRATGSEGSTVSVSLSGSAKGAAFVWRITGAADPSITSAATGTSATPDPPATPALTGDYLFLWLGGWEGEQTNPPSGSPPFYSKDGGAGSGTAGSVSTNCRVAGASRQRTGLVSQSEDPGEWTISASDDWTAFTLYVTEPAAKSLVFDTRRVARNTLLRM